MGCNSDIEKISQEKSFCNELAKFCENPIKVFSPKKSDCSATFNKAKFDAIIKYADKIGRDYKDLQKIPQP